MGGLVKQLEQTIIEWAEVYLPISYGNYNRALRNEETDKVKRLTKSIRQKYKEEQNG